MKWRKVFGSLWVFDDSCRVYAIEGPIAMELSVAGRPFGQVAEALITIGEPIW